MSEYKDRVNEKLELHGENLMINDTPVKGFFMLTDLTKINTNFNSMEAGYLNKPILTVQLSADTAVAVSDTIERDGRVYEVSKIARYRIDNELVFQSAILT